MFQRVRPEKLSRWVHEQPGGSIDQELGELLRSLPPGEPLAPATLAVVARRIGRDAESGPKRPKRALLLAFAVLIGTTGVAVAQWARPSVEAGPSGPVPALANGFAPRAARAATRVAAAAPASAATPPSEAAKALPVVAPPAPAEAPPSKLVSPPASQLALESALLQRALSKLRGEHDAKTALTLLDDYQARFPGGLLSTEASLARVDACLLLGRRAEALALLLRLPLERVGRRRELQLVRAELRAERDCARALGDFDAVLSTPGPAGLTERALYGRAACRLRLGQSAAARADLEAYLVRYPAGRFEKTVRARLASH